MWGVLPNEVMKDPPAIVVIVPLSLKSKYKTRWVDGDNQRGDGPDRWPQFVIGLEDKRFCGLEG